MRRHCINAAAVSALLVTVTAAVLYGGFRLADLADFSMAHF